MNTIWKFELEDTDEQTIEAPDNSKVLTVQVQHGITCLWMLVDPNTPVRKYGVRIFGTGHPVNISGDDWVYAGTYQLHNGLFIGHVFVA